MFTPNTSFSNNFYPKTDWSLTLAWTTGKENINSISIYELYITKFLRLSTYSSPIKCYNATIHLANLNKLKRNRYY